MSKYDNSVDSLRVVLANALIPGSGYFLIGHYRFGCYVCFFFYLAFGIASYGIFQGFYSGLDALVGMAMRITLFLYAFMVLDGFFTTEESKRDQCVGINPRVTFILNLTTRGFGYLYCGALKRGLLSFFVLGLFAKLIQIEPVAEAFVEIAMWLIAFDGYRLTLVANRQALDSEPSANIEQDKHELKTADYNRGAGGIAFSLAALAVGLYGILLTIGLVMPIYDDSIFGYNQVLGRGLTTSFTNQKISLDFSVPSPCEVQKSEKGNGEVVALACDGNAYVVKLFVEAVNPIFVDELKFAHNFKLAFKDRYELTEQLEVGKGSGRFLKLGFVSNEGLHMDLLIKVFPKSLSAFTFLIHYRDTPIDLPEVERKIISSFSFNRAAS